MTQLRVVDGDGHIMEEPNDIWTPERIDHDRWGDWVPRKVVEDEIYETTYVGGAVRGGGRELHDQMAAAVGMTPRQFYDLLEGLRRPGGHEPTRALADMDADGIDAVGALPELRDVLRPVRRDRRAARRRVRRRLSARVQRLACRLLRARPAPAVRCRRACRCRTSTARVAEVEHAVERGLQRRVRPAVGLRRRVAAQPPRVRRLLGRPASGSAFRSRSTPACTSTRPVRAASSGSSRSARTRRSPTWRWTRSTAAARSARRSATPST